MSTTTFTPDAFANWLPKDSRSNRPTGWSVGVMRYIVKALEGVPCLIEVDKMTHHTVDGMLIGLLPGGGGRLPRLTVRYDHGDDCTSPRPLADGRVQAACPRTCKGYHDTNHYLQGIGVIIPLPRRDGVPSIYDVTRELFKDGADCTTAVWAYMTEQSGAHWYGKHENMPAEDGVWSSRWESQVRDGQQVPTGYAMPPLTSYGAPRKWLAMTVDLEAGKVVSTIG